MGTTKIIPSKSKPQPKLRVAAYCRVSTRLAEQQSSLMAQDESYSKSENIKCGLRKSFQNLDSKYYQRVCYGYTHDQGGKLVIHEEQAEIVRLIYEMSAAGDSLAKISAHPKDMDLRQGARESGAKKRCEKFSLMKNIRAVLLCKKHLLKIIWNTSRSKM